MQYTNEAFALVISYRRPLTTSMVEIGTEEELQVLSTFQAWFQRYMSIERTICVVYSHRYGMTFRISSIGLLHIAQIEEILQQIKTVLRCRRIVCYSR